MKLRKLFVCRFLKASLDKEQEANLTCADMVTYLQRSCFLEGLACVVQRVMYLINYTMKYKEDPCKMPLTGVVNFFSFSVRCSQLCHLLAL